MFLPLEYINYRWNAKGRHGIHSPFVYDFVDKCLRLPVDKSDENVLERLFDTLRADARTISIEDFGAGSKKLGNERKVSQIFRMSSSKGKYGELLYRIALYYQPEKVLELGTSLGIGATYLALGAKNAHITTLEACKNTRTIALENIGQNSQIESVLNTFDDFIQKLPNEEKFDLIYVDGHHDGNALLRYMDKLYEHSHDDTLFLLDDIRWSDSMKNAWITLANDSRFNLSIELFRVGIISKKQSMEKKNFVVHY